MPSDWGLLFCISKFWERGIKLAKKAQTAEKGHTDIARFLASGRLGPFLEPVSAFSKVASEMDSG